MPSGPSLGPPEALLLSTTVEPVPGFPITIPDPIDPAERLPHPPILLVGAGGLTLGNGLRGGTGTATDPFLVSGWEIDLRPLTPRPAGTPAPVLRDAITIRDTVAHIVVADNVVRGAPGNAILVQSAPNVRIERNLIHLDNAVLAPDFESTAVRPVAIFASSGVSAIRSNTIIVENVGHRAAAGIWLLNSAADVTSNTIVNQAVGLLYFDAVVNDRGLGTRFVGNTIANSGSTSVFAGMRIREGRATMKGNVIGGAGLASQVIGIELSRGFFTTAEENRITVTGTGIYAVDGSGNTIRANKVTGGQLGIVIQRERGDLVRDNEIVGVAYGFGMLGALDDHFANTIPLGNTVDGKAVRLLTGLRNTTVDGASYPPTAWLGIVGARNVTVRNVQITGAVQGLLLGDFDKGLVENVDASGNWRGIDLSASYASRITSSRGSSVALLGSVACRVDNSTFSGGVDTATGAYGFRVGPYAAWVGASSQHVTFDHVTLETSGVALFSQRSVGTTVKDSLLRTNGYGGYFEFASGDVLRNNVIAGNVKTVEGIGSSVDAKLNWWGGAGGPGTIDPGQFSVSPWLTSAPVGAGDP